MTTSGKIDQKIKKLTTGSKYGLNPDGLDYEGMVRKHNYNKITYRYLFPFSVILLIVTCSLLIFSVTEIINFELQPAALFILISISLSFHAFRLKNEITKLDTALFLYQLKKEIEESNAVTS